MLRVFRRAMLTLREFPGTVLAEFLGSLLIRTLVFVTDAMMY